MVPVMNVAAERDWKNVIVCFLHILPFVCHRAFSLGILSPGLSA